MRMRNSALIAILVSSLLASASGQARTATAKERHACEAKAQQKIDAIDSKLRAGYSPRDGERLKERRRKLEDERARCRQARGLGELRS